MTRLTQTNGDNADWEISGYVSDYSVSTSGISQQQSSINRLNVSVHITLFNRKGSDQKNLMSAILLIFQPIKLYRLRNPT